MLWYRIIGVPTKLWPPPVQSKIEQRIFAKQEGFESEMPVVRDMIEPILIFSNGKVGTHRKAPMLTV